MDILFDSYGRHEIPVITLANPNKTELGTLGNASGLNITYNFNAVSEASFTYPYQDIDKLKSPYYDDLIEHRLVKIENNGWWIIQNIKDNDGNWFFCQAHDKSYN